jgi:hypothetical protein
MEVNTGEVDEHLQFAYEACQDNNAYTSSKTILKIIEDGGQALREDKVKFAFSVFPELDQG